MPFSHLSLERGSRLEEEKISLEEGIARLFFFCLYHLQQTTSPEWQNLEITMAQLKVLLHLHVAGPLSNGKLAERLHISHPTASHLVEKLVQNGLAERSEQSNDRRTTLVLLTEHGQSLLQSLLQGRHGRLRDWLLQLDEQDLVALRQGLSALSRVIRASS